MNYVLAWPVWWNPLHWLQHASATLPFVRDYNLLRLSQRERAGLQRGAAFMSQGRGYQAIQGTRPQTLGYGLQDSPAGGLRLLCSVRGVCDRAGKQWRVRAPRRWATTACRLPCSLAPGGGGGGWGGLVLRSWAAASCLAVTPSGITPSETGFGLQGHVAGGMELGHHSPARPVCCRDACSSCERNRQSMARRPRAGTWPAAHAVGMQAALQHCMLWWISGRSVHGEALWHSRWEPRSQQV